MDRSKFEEMKILEKFVGPARPVLSRECYIDIYTRCNMEKQRADRLERQLLECYRKYPRLHYDNCSDYAKAMLFHPPDAEGNVQYINPTVQTVEPPF